MLPASRFLARLAIAGARGPARHYAEAAAAGPAQMAFTFASPSEVLLWESAGGERRGWVGNLCGLIPERAGRQLTSGTSSHMTC